MLNSGGGNNLVRGSAWLNHPSETYERQIGSFP